MENNAPQANNKNKSSIIILVIVLLVIAGIVIYSIVSKEDKAPTNTATVASQAGDATSTTKAETTTELKLEGITDSEISCNNVTWRDGGGHYGVVMNFTCNDKCDGFEVKKTCYPGEEYESITYSYLPSTCTSMYFGTQDSVPIVEIRSYIGDPKSADAKFSEWRTVFDYELEEAAGSSYIYDDEWDKLIANSYSIDD